MLNSEVAMGRRMKGAEKCIYVLSAQSSNHGLSVKTTTTQIIDTPILIEPTESFLNLLPAYQEFNQTGAQSCPGNSPHSRD